MVKQWDRDRADYLLIRLVGGALMLALASEFGAGISTGAGGLARDSHKTQPGSRGSGSRDLYPRACVGTPRTRLREASMFAVGILPDCVALAFINQRLYGSLFESGYGSTEELFKIE